MDSANAARDFLRSYGISENAVERVWDAIALHTTPGIPEHKKPEVALGTSGVEMDVLGLAYDEFTDAQRDAVVAAYPESIVQEGHYPLVLSGHEASAIQYLRNGQ